MPTNSDPIPEGYKPPQPYKYNHQHVSVPTADPEAPPKQHTILTISGVFSNSQLYYNGVVLPLGSKTYVHVYVLPRYFADGVTERYLVAIAQYDNHFEEYSKLHLCRAQLIEDLLIDGVLNNSGSLVELQYTLGDSILDHIGCSENCSEEVLQFLENMSLFIIHNGNYGDHNDGGGKISWKIDTDTLTLDHNQIVQTILEEKFQL